MGEKLNIFWFRRDLRLEDNKGLSEALKSNHPVQCIFILDKNILKELPKADKRVLFIYKHLERLNNELQNYGSNLKVFHSTPLEVYENLTLSYELEEVYLNKDYEPYALKRDKIVSTFLKQKDIMFKSFKDHVIFEHQEVTKDDGKPYTVFTPYKRKWKSRLEMHGVEEVFKSYSIKGNENNFLQSKSDSIPTFSSLGFIPAEYSFPKINPNQSIITNYAEKRDFPALNGTSKLGIHFRFGTISIRDKARKALKLSDVYLNELIWRDFYQMILSNFPHVVLHAFKPKYDKIEWRESPKDFKLWCQGKTGYPLVDAGMRELNQTGFMHNRVRMLVASFLTKHLLIDWRKGEAYFAQKLLDFDLASNNGGWQWAAGCGTDAAPYFRIFSPDAQQKKFDPQFINIKKWIPEYGSSAYPEPIVEHKFARQRCLSTYKSALNSN